MASSSISMDSREATPESAATQSGQIRCVFFSEFHATRGPQLVYQVRWRRRAHLYAPPLLPGYPCLLLLLYESHYSHHSLIYARVLVLSRFLPLHTTQDPPGFISQDLFTLIEKYIITKPELCGRLVSLLVPPPRTRTHSPTLTHTHTHMHTRLPSTFNRKQLRQLRTQLN